MKKIFITFPVCLSLTMAFSQSTHKISAYIQGQFTQTVYDITTGNNPWAIGAGLQFFYNSHSKFKPTIDMTADLYLEDDKVFRTGPNGTEIIDINGLVNTFAGVSFHPDQKVYFSFVTGPCFIAGETRLGIKPSAGIYFSKSQKWTAKLSFINIFKRDKPTSKDLGSLSLGIGIKLF